MNIDLKAQILELIIFRRENGENAKMRYVISAILLAQLFPASERDEYEDTLGFWLLSTKNLL